MTLQSPVSQNRAAASFRDPSGFVYREDGAILRQVNEIYRAHYDRLMGGLYQQLIASQQLIPHEEIQTEVGAYKTLRPQQVPFISYPYEWSFSQLQDAALATLKIQQAALAKGMTLKDASAYNIQFIAGKPVLIDTLSFEEYKEGEPWIAYGQFCRHFLAPLALMAKVDFRLQQLLRVHIDGIPLDLASRLLPTTTKFSLGLGLHLHGHARSQMKHSNVAVSAKPQAAIKISRHSLDGLIDNLITTISKLTWRPGKTEWADYYSANNNYGDEGLASKEKTLRQLLEGTIITTAWDLGGNTGRFSRILAERGTDVVCWDVDPACVEANYRQVRGANEKHVLPLLLDLTNPSPALGWAHRERDSLEQRGPVGAVLALGLIHHLAISNNVPLETVAEYLARLGKTLYIEFVPKEDSQVKKLLATREDIFPKYHRQGFEAEFSRYFEIEKSLEIPGTLRTLYRMHSRNK